VQEFVVIDVETANPDFSSICQVGIASFHDGELADGWESLVNPLDDFSPINTSIHGICASDVEESPTWPELASHIDQRLRGRIVVSHTAFDRVALARASERFDLDGCDYQWLDSAKVVRRAWSQFSRRDTDYRMWQLV
jgi:DNA polymerase-3 subunit epsilon